jgi:hypothetical protein
VAAGPSLLVDQGAENEMMATPISTYDPKIQQEPNIALGYHVRAGSERGAS